MPNKRGPIVPLPKLPKKPNTPKPAPASSTTPTAPAAKKRPAAAPTSKSEPAELPKKKHKARPPPATVADVDLTAEARCWDSESEHLKLAPNSVAWEPTAVEVLRGAALRRLRLSLGEATRALQLRAPLVGAFERWHFGWLLAATTSGESLKDPLLPLGASVATAGLALAAELESAGAAAAAAAEIAAQLVFSAQREAEALVAARQRAVAGSGGSDGLAIELAVTEGGLAHVTWPGAETPLKLGAEHLSKLRTMHERVRAPAEHAGGSSSGGGSGGVDGEVSFRHDLARLLLRYKALGGSGFQAALGGAAHAALRDGFGCGLECFASPLNARTAPFCSGFLDVDAPFGSLGSFLDFSPAEGCFEANPPFAPALVVAMATHMQRLLRRAERNARPLLFAVVVGSSSAMKASEAWAALQRLATGDFGRAQWVVPLQHHGYTEGHAHIAKGGAREATKMSSCESTVFLLASSAAAARWPVTHAKEAALRAAMRATIPRNLHRATKANAKVHRQRVKLKKSKAKQ